MSLLTPQRPADPTAGAHTHSAATMVPDRSRAERTRSFDVADFPVPHGREEDWRFTPVDRLTDLLDGTSSGTRPTVSSTLPGGVSEATISTAQARALGIMLPADRAAAVAVAGSGGAIHYAIARDAEPTQPVHIRLTGSGEIAFGHVVLTAGRNSRATVVVTHDGIADLGEMLSVVSEDGAQLTLVTLQEWDSGSRHLGQHDVVVGRDATVRHIVITLGGSVVRLSTNVTYSGPGGSFEGLGVYFADAGQHLEHRLFVDHEAPHCRSQVEYKGALQGESARTVWVGDVLIRAGAEGTDTYELNRNLVLTEGARADSVPNLEIETGEIQGAGHASATGRFDDEQLFYLRARGIPEDEARRLVVRGFFAAVIARIGVPEVEEHLMAAIEQELSEGVA